MKIGSRLSVSSLFFITLLSTVFLAASSSSFFSADMNSARATSFDRQISQLRAEIYRLLKEGTYSPALSKVKRYVFLVKRKYGSRHPRFAEALKLKAKVYTKLNRRFEAKRFHARATAILRNHRKHKERRQL